MKAVKIGLLVLMAISLVAVVCYAETAKEHYDAGSDFLGRRMYDQAIVALQEAIEIDPQYTAAHYY